MDILGQLGSIPLFEGLPPAQLEDLTMIVTDQVFGRGRLIFSEGDEGAGFYVVVTGRVKIFKLSVEGKEQILHFFGPGEVFGEVPVFAGEEFPAHAEAAEESRVFFFPRSSLLELIKANPDLALNMLGILAKRLRRFTALIENLSLKEVPGRVAAYLLFLSERSDNARQLALDISKGQLASLLGTIPETLSRVLGKLKKAGLIDTEGARIRILDSEALRDLAEGMTRI